MWYLPDNISVHQALSGDCRRSVAFHVPLEMPFKPRVDLGGPDKGRTLLFMLENQCSILASAPPKKRICFD